MGEPIPNTAGTTAGVPQGEERDGSERVPDFGYATITVDLHGYSGTRLFIMDEGGYPLPSHIAWSSFQRYAMQDATTLDPSCTLVTAGHHCVVRYRLSDIWHLLDTATRRVIYTLHDMHQRRQEHQRRRDMHCFLTDGLARLERSTADRFAENALTVLVLANYAVHPAQTSQPADPEIERWKELVFARVDLRRTETAVSEIHKRTTAFAAQLQRLIDHDADPASFREHGINALSGLVYGFERVRLHLTSDWADHRMQ